MPRHARTTSSYGLYHVMSRGVNKQRIFFDEEDCRFYKRALCEAIQDTSVELLGYCLMPNHVHLLIFDPENELSGVIHVVNQRHAQRINWKYGRVGHLFQDRFKSQNIEDEAYLISALRYIHNNPEKAGICKALSYPWSSAREYAGTPEITNTRRLLPLFAFSGGFLEYSKGSDDFDHIDVDDDQLSSEEAVEVVTELLGSNDLKDLGRLSISLRNCLIKRAAEQGATSAQLSTLFGLSRSTINRALKS